MAEDAIIITLPANAPPETVARVRAAFPDAAFAELAPETPPDAAAAAEQAVADAVASAAGLPAMLAEFWAAAGGWTALLWIALALAAGLAAREGVLRALGFAGAQPDGATRGQQDDPAFRPRLAAGARWFAARLIGFVVLAVVATVVWRVGPLETEAARMLARGVLGAVMFALFLRLLSLALLSPRAAGRRMLGFTDDEAAQVARAMMVVVAATALFGVLRAVFSAAAAATGDPEPAALPRLALTLADGAVAIWFFLATRHGFRALCLRAVGEAASAATRRLVGFTSVFFALVATLDTAVKGAGALGLLGAGSATGSGPTLLIMVMTPLAVIAVRLWAQEAPEQDRTPLFEGAVAVAEGAVVVVAGVMLLRGWGLDPFTPAASGIAAFAPALVEAFVALAVGFALWRAASALLRKPQPKNGGAELGEIGGEGDRMATIVPILRGAALGLIALTTSIAAMAALGVNVTPLLASAGVLGLAIGFGAQKLVADVISGLFYLYEDAIRVGEYVETDAGKGTVEKISLRSAMLRHPRGPVVTAPFSSMGTIENHSRDWAVMKFSFSVPNDTDVEMVRKTVKKIGIEMMNDPELEGKIIAPLKSQGALAISGRNFEIGCKFMAKPGEQFIIRRKAYAALQRGLKEKGVQLAAPDFNLDPGVLGPG